MHVQRNVGLCPSTLPRILAQSLGHDALRAVYVSVSNAIYVAVILWLYISYSKCFFLQTFICLCCRYNCFESARIWFRHPNNRGLLQVRICVMRARMCAIYDLKQILGVVLLVCSWGVGIRRMWYYEDIGLEIRARLCKLNSGRQFPPTEEDKCFENRLDDVNNIRYVSVFSNQCLRFVYI